MKDYKRLGIAALIFNAGAIMLAILSLGIIQYPLFLFLPVIIIASLVLSIISLRGMRKHHSKGLWIPISALVISVILLIPVIYIIVMWSFLFIAFIPETVYSYEVPMTVTIDTFNYEFNKLASSDTRDIFVFTHPKGDDFPEMCAPEFFMFHSLQPLVYFNKDARYSKTAPEDYRDPYRGHASTFPMNMIKDKPTGEKGITFFLGEKASRTYMIDLIEKYNNPGETKELLKSGNDEFYIRYYYNPARVDPRKEYAINTTGCYPFPRASTEGILEIRGTSGIEKKHESQIVCLKQFHTYEVYPTKFKLDDCTFYEISYDINIEYNIDLSQGQTKKTVIPVHI